MPCKISSRSVEPLWKYCEFSIFNMAAVHHLEFLKYANFYFPIVCCPNLHIRAKFRRDRMNGCRDIMNFQFPVWQPSAILNFSNMRIFTFRTVCNGNLHVPAKFRLGGLHGCGIIKNLIFSIWRSSAILGLLYACVGPPTMCSSWSSSLYKICLKSVQ